MMQQLRNFHKLIVVEIAFGWFHTMVCSVQLVLNSMDVLLLYQGKLCILYEGNFRNTVGGEGYSGIIV